ncbi:MAG: indole-3-glycerol phosphate synthase TrpC [Candidatus Omnitrophica bacterium]|nr:indole-3-glycerol phosphate synthase TrpC [Candidatus Omnitrophota bacterium]
MVLNDILEHKRQEVVELKSRFSLPALQQMAEREQGKIRSLQRALTGDRKLHLICELKKASPSEGLLRNPFEPKTLAQVFELAGASAISVLTEKRYFQGNPQTLAEIRPLTSIPLLRKDFIFDPYQVYETRVLGADAFLIIAMLVSKEQLQELLEIARKLNLEVLVEVHTKEELNRALEVGVQVIGINNRNLTTLEIDLAVSEQLIRFIPKNTIAVIESGIETPEEIQHFQSLGAHCFLVGTALMKSQNVKEKILELSGQKTKVN